MGPVHKLFSSQGLNKHVCCTAC